MSAENDVKKLAELIKGIKVAMLTTVCADGSLRSRPMVTQDKEFDGTLWFFTPAESPKVHEYQERFRAMKAREVAQAKERLEHRT